MRFKLLREHLCSMLSILLSSIIDPVLYLCYTTRPSWFSAWLNEQGFRTKNKHKFQRPDGEITSGRRLFTGYSVSGILHNPFFTGKIAYKGEAHPGAHEAIISEELFNAVQQKLKNAKSRSMTVSTSYRAYMLKGIARCVYCGYPMWSETSKSGYSYYRGQRSPHSDTKCPAAGKAYLTLTQFVNLVLKPHKI